jgi:hypothetical protein
MTKKFGESIDELVAQLNATEPMEVMEPPEGSKVDDLCFFEPRTLQPEEVRERARYHLECIASGPNESYSIKERKKLAKLIGYKGKIKVDEYLRGMIIKENLKLAGGIALWAAVLAGAAFGGYYLAKIINQ